MDNYDIKIENSPNTTGEDYLFKINETFGYLVVLEDGEMTQRKLDLLNEIVFNGNLIEGYSSEDFDDNSIQKKLFKQVNSSYSNLLESNIFEAKLLTVLVSF